jgi:hypothetical protein
MVVDIGRGVDLATPLLGAARQRKERKEKKRKEKGKASKQPKAGERGMASLGREWEQQLQLKRGQHQSCRDCLVAGLIEGCGRGFCCSTC